MALLLSPGYNESHSKPTPSSHNADDRGKASHTWHTQNAVNKKQMMRETGGNGWEEQVPTHMGMDMETFTFNFFLFLKE